MANVFKNELRRNVGSTEETLYQVPVDNKSIIIELDVCNTTNGSVTCDVFITKGGLDFFVVKGAPVPVGGSLQVISGQKIVLEAGDTLKIKSSTAASLDAIVSILEDV
jgi:hypothetical protein